MAKKNILNYFLAHICGYYYISIEQNTAVRDFPSGPAVKNSPNNRIGIHLSPAIAQSGDMGSVPGWGRSRMLQSS